MIPRRVLRAVVFLSLGLAPPVSAQWAADIDFLRAELPRVHANLFHSSSPESWVMALNDLKARTAELSDLEIILSLQRIVASLHDAHTLVDTSAVLQNVFPVRLKVFSDGIFVVRTNATSRVACGAQLIAINGIPAEQVFTRVAEFVSAENDAWLLAQTPELMMRPEVLFVAGIIPSKDSALFTFAIGQRLLDLQLDATTALLPPQPDVAGLPLYRRNASLNYWYEWQRATGLLYLKYNVCANDPARPFANATNELLTILDTEPVHHFVIDLRDNTGGNTEIARALINGIRARPHLRGRVYAIIGPKTFSSAMLNAFDLESGGAILAGDSTGGKPNSYGEVRSFLLPNSRVRIFHSTRLFSIVQGDPASLEPSLRIPISSFHYRFLQDPVLSAIAPTARIASTATDGRRRAVAKSLTCDY
ncbi:MAG TPA: hypothetical protein VEK79_07010 [Thermoanaerobaculia bacterium]|nr:hypothetical protein [Thermoanaerobaculia bacterium]